MLKHKRKSLIPTFVLVSFITIIAYFIFTPVSAMVHHVSIRTYTEKRLDSLQEYVKHNTQLFNVYNDEITVENVDDFVQVHYSLKIKNHGLSNMRQIRGYVINVPENDSSFISADNGEWARQTWFWGTSLCVVNITIYRNGLTDEELLDKLKHVKLGIIYEKKGVYDSCTVKNTDSIKDIRWEEK